MRWKTYMLSSIILIIGMVAILFTLSENNENRITGLFSFVEIAPEGFEFELPKNITEKMASEAIHEAKVEIAEMKKRNFTITFVNDVLNEANMQYKLGNYTEVLKMEELIKFINKKKMEFIDMVALTERKMREYNSINVDTSEAQALIWQALAAFGSDQMVDAQELLKQADISLELAKSEKERQKNIAYLGKNFIMKYWKQIIIVIALLSIASFLIAKTTIKKRLHRKLTDLRDELGKTQELIKQLQKECFIDKKITTDAYRQKAAKYEERIAKIKCTMPVIEAQLHGERVKPTKKIKGILEVNK